MNRNELRIKAMHILYQVGLYNKNNIDYILNDIIENIEPEANEFVISLVQGTLSHQKELDDLANKYLDSWPMTRLSLPDQAIIRIAIYEMLYTDTPNKVCIDEAIEISKKYSDDQVTKMINGVLDKIYHNEAKDEQ